MRYIVRVYTLYRDLHTDRFPHDTLFLSCWMLHYNANDQTRLHFRIWQKLFPNTQHVFVAPRGLSSNKNNENSTTLAFYSAEERDEFNEWANAYEDRFPTGLTEPFPSLPNGFISGYVHRSQQAIMNTDIGEIEKEWLWILQNLRGQAWRLFQGWVFENEEDMVLFALKFK